MFGLNKLMYKSQVASYLKWHSCDLVVIIPTFLFQKGCQSRDSDATTSCDEDGYSTVDRYSGGVRRFPQPEPPDHYPLASNHLNHTAGRNHNHNFPTLTKAELEVSTIWNNVLIPSILPIHLFQYIVLAIIT